MMPARIASTPADEQIKEFVGSGPFKFAREEWQPGEQVAYVRNSEYVPRDDITERIDRRQEGVPRQGRLAIHTRPLGCGGRPRGGQGGLVGATANRLHPQDRAEPGPTDFTHRSSWDAGLAQAELPPPAIQQQEGARGTAPHDGSSDISRLVHRTVAILPDLRFGLCM